MSRAPLIPCVLALCFCARIALAQDGLPPTPPEPDVPDEAPAADPGPPPDPSPPPPSPRVEPEPTPEPQRAQRRYEGQVSEGGAEYAYDDDAAPAGEDSGGGGGGGGFDMPGFSIRIDPFNWLLEGRLGLELEVVVWKFISVELVPVFVANTEPPSFNLSFSGREDPLSQHSNGLGPIAGVSIGAGFWLTGTPLRGYVLRATLTDYNYTYEARDRLGVFDSVSHADRRFIVSIGSYSRFGFFTIGGDLGLGYELNQAQRCIVNSGTTRVTTATSGCPDEDELQIMADRDGDTVADLNGGFHPIYVVASISLGVSFD